MTPLSPLLLDTAKSPCAQLQFAPVNCWKPGGEFWKNLCREKLREMLLEEYRQMVATSRIENFRVASGRSKEPFKGIFFNDSDVYKWMEAAAWFHAAEPDPEVDDALEHCIDEVIAAQESDGYLNSYFTAINRIDPTASCPRGCVGNLHTFIPVGELDGGRWSRLRDMHQLYCAGHLFQAAVAHYRSTGATRLLDAARRFADCICCQFGPAVGGRQEETDGHPEIEMGLVELYRATGEGEYLRQAQFFLDVRGQKRVPNDQTLQQHAPYREIREMTGHAVRALYLAAGATDIFLESGDTSLLPAIHGQWHSFQTKRRHVTGGAGARWNGEEFGDDYELPHRGYCETCAAIASMMWSQRLFAKDANPASMDSLEWTFFNAVLPGISRSGKEFYYQNPLLDNGGHRRKQWFECACCPPNVARLLASLPAYAFSVAKEAVWIHLPLGGQTTLFLPDGQTAALEIAGDYPWGGQVDIKVKSQFTGALFIRIPAWCEEAVAVRLNGNACAVSGQPGSYLKIEHEWQPGDRLQYCMSETPRLIEPHPAILECHGLVAVARGPILFCTEADSNPDIDLRYVELIADAVPEISKDETSPAPGAVRLTWPSRLPQVDKEWGECLQRTRKPPAVANAEPCRLTLIPYFCWGNGKPGRMQVWQKWA